MAQFWNWLGNTANILGVLTAIVATMTWWVARRARYEAQERERIQNTPIDLFLVNDESAEELRLPYAPIRRTLSRAEVQGILGMFAAGRRYELPRLTEVFCQGQFDKAIQGQQNCLRIPCPPKEFGEFKKIAQEAID